VFVVRGDNNTWPGGKWISLELHLVRYDQGGDYPLPAREKRGVFVKCDSSKLCLLGGEKRGCPMPYFSMESALRKSATTTRYKKKFIQQEEGTRQSRKNEEYARLLHSPQPIEEALWRGCWRQCPKVTPCLSGSFGEVAENAFKKRDWIGSSGR